MFWMSYDEEQNCRVTVEACVSKSLYLVFCRSSATLNDISDSLIRTFCLTYLIADNFGYYWEGRYFTDELQNFATWVWLLTRCPTTSSAHDILPATRHFMFALYVARYPGKATDQPRTG